MIRLVVFDLDNTLTDFMRMKEQAIDASVEAMIDAGLMNEPERIRNEIGRIYEERGIEFQKVFDRLLTDLLGEVDYKILAAGIVGYRRAREAALVLYPHVKITLFALMRRGLRLGVVSDAPRHEAWLRLCYLQLHQVFDAVLAHEDTGAYKPDPAPFRAVLERTGIPPAEALIVGDWPERDIAGAKEMGMTTVFARYGDTFDTSHSGADYDIDYIYELVGIIDEINGAASAGGGQEVFPAD